MVPQQFKDLFFSVMRVGALAGAAHGRVRYARPARPEGHYLHLGCGAHYIPGMINLDGNLFQRKEVWADMRNGLPFGADSAHFVYMSHVLEHFYPDDALALLREIRRVLRPDGRARIAVPSMEHAAQIISGAAVNTWPRGYSDPAAQAVDYLFCDGQHKYAYSFTIMELFCRKAGFREVTHYSDAQGTSPKQYGAVTVGGEVEGSLVVELSK